MTPYERLQSVCKQAGTTVTKFCLEITGSKGNLATWKKGNFSTNNLSIIQQKFNISIDWLLFGDKISQEKTPTSLGQLDINISSQENIQLLIAKCSNIAELTELAELSNDKDFVDSAKLYKALAIEYKKQICAYILGVATTLGLNVAQILEK